MNLFYGIDPMLAPEAFLDWNPGIGEVWLFV
jgi:hypothetical protein